MIPLLRTYLRPYSTQLVIVIALLLVQAIANLYLPELNADIINNGVVKGDTDYIMRTGAVMLVVTFALGIAAIVGVYFGARVAMGFGRDVRGAIFRRVETFSQAGDQPLRHALAHHPQHQRRPAGPDVRLHGPDRDDLGADPGHRRGHHGRPRRTCRCRACCVVILPIMVRVIGVVMSRADPALPGHAGEDRPDQPGACARRSPASGSSARSCGPSTRSSGSRRPTATSRRPRCASTGCSPLTIPAIMLILNLSTVAVMWFGRPSASTAATMPIGNLTAFLAYLMQILLAVLMAVMMFILVPRAAVSAERIKEVLRTEPSVADPAGAGAARPSVAAESSSATSSFGYPGAEDPVLRAISFTAEPGKTTAIVGSTGSGKSTLVNLIPRFYDVTGGPVLVDGVDVRRCRRPSCGRASASCPRRRSCSAARSRATCGIGDAGGDRRASSGTRSRSPRRATSSRQMPRVGSTRRSTRAARTSRAASASAWPSPGRSSKRPQVYVFDDSFSALDFATDARLRAALAPRPRRARP